MEERSSGFVIYRMEEGKPLYLLIRSSGDGYWGFPKGKIDPGENSGEAARRELHEETGINDFEVHDDFERSISYWYTRDKRKIHKEVKYYLASTDEKDVELSSEHSEYKWLSFNEASELIAFKNLRETIEKADKFISSG